MAKNTHTIMPHSLAKALMEAGMKHFDAGGMTTGGIAGIPGALTVQNDYQAKMAPQDHSNYGPNIQGSFDNATSGYGQSQNIQQQQQALADALLRQTQGVGPNPVQAQLATNTGNNVAQTAALMASQRGSGANAGLLATQAARQGANTQQSAAGQAATLQAQQQLAAETELQKQQAEMASGNVAEQGLNAQLYQTSAGAQNTQNANNIQNMGMAQGINSQIAQNNANAVNKTQAGMVGGVAQSLPVIGQLFAKGGEVPEHIHAIAKIYHAKKYSVGGDVGSVANVSIPNLSNADALKSTPDIFSKDKSSGGGKPSSPISASPLEDLGGAGPSGAGGMAGSDAGAADLAPLLLAAKNGLQVPGRAKVKGNSEKNDTQLALLSPGEDVIPRSITQSKDAPKKAAEFVRHLQEQKKGKKEEPKGFDKVVQSKKSLKERVETLEKLYRGGAA